MLHAQHRDLKTTAAASLYIMTVCCRQVNGMLLNDKKVYVGPFQKRTDRSEDGDVRYTNVFVKNLAESVSDEKLREMFAEFGTITSAVVMRVSPA